MTRMKESGIDWIGQIPQEWEVSKLEHYVDIFGRIGFRGYTTNDIVNEGEGVISFSPSNIIDYSVIDKNNTYISWSKYNESPEIQIKIGDVLYVKTGSSYGKTGIVNKLSNKATINPQLVVLKPKKYTDSRLINYFLNSSVGKEQSELIVGGSTIPTITQESIKKMIFPKMSFEEQQKIADFLDKKTAQLDKVKALLEEQIQKLKDYRASLIYETVTKGLDKTVPMKDSGIDWIGQVPQGWGVSKLKFILEKGSNSIKVGPFGSSLSGDAIRSSGKWVYNQRNVLDNNFTETDFYISEAKCKELKNFSVSSGDILLTTRGTIGRVAIVPKKYCEGIIHPCLMKFKVDSRIVLPELIKYLFNDIPLVREQLNFLSNSTTIDVIYSYNLKNIIIPTIPIEEQYSILEVLDRQTSDVDALIKIKQKQIENINKQRQTLIYDYVTGKRRV